MNEPAHVQTSDDASTDTASPANPIQSGFDLFHHRGLLVLVILFGVAGAYTLVDTFFLLPYTALAGMPLWPFALVAVLTAPAAILIGRGAPALERYAMAALVVVAVTWAVYPVMLRVNALTGEAEAVTYQSTETGVFEDPSGTYPRIDLAGHVAPAYWQDHGIDEPHRFRLVKGSLGFYQLDLRPVYQRIGLFRRQQG